MTESLVEINGIKKYFSQGKKQTVRSVDDISFHIKRGETFGLVGESGSGKTTLGRTVVGLHNKTDGVVTYDGKNIDGLSRKEKKETNRLMQMIFQDPHASLNPRMKVGDIVAEGLDAHKKVKGKEREAMIFELLETVGLRPESAKRYPHEFSGGQRQRIGIARALAVDPEFIVADEPISALDVSIQAQIINLLKKLQTDRQLTYLFIAHDLAMVKHISDRIGVMYLGKLVELTKSEQLFEEPLHPYTEALLSAVPEPDINVKHKERIILQGDPPNPAKPPTGCRFHTRCPMATEVCRQKEPIWKEHVPGHWVACHLY